jgi:hypothetical protein
MLPQNNRGDKPYDVPRNLQSNYTNIHWDKLPPGAVAVLSLGSDTANFETLYYLAACMARLPGRHRPRVEAALDLWVAGNKRLEPLVTPAVRRAFETVFANSKGAPPVSKNLTANEKRIFAALTNLQPSPHEIFEVSYKQIAEESGVPIRSVIRSVKKMAEVRGAIEMAPPEPGNPHASNAYRIPEEK